MNLVCWWKGHDRMDLFKGTEFQGVNVYCPRCFKPIEPEESWTQRYMKVQNAITQRRSNATNY